jgi:radical SAM protein with 4Fe4S-binding SPASM domain
MEDKPVFGFQWHITDRCNLRCKHCYQDNFLGLHELDLDGLKQVANKIMKTLAKWGKKGDIAITGGEPLVKTEMLPLVNYLNSADEVVSIDILTNGTLLDADIIKQIRRFDKIRCFQVSLDGASPVTNDSIRGKGSFEKALAGIRLLRENDIIVNVMFTLQRMNTRDVPLIIDLANVEGVSTLTIERMVPTGTGKNLMDQLLMPEEIREVFEHISEHAEQQIKETGSTSISRSRPLWVLCSHNRDPINANLPTEITLGGICSIGLDGLCILPDATVLACRRLPIPIGNLKQDSIEKIWFTSDLLWQIRDKNNLKHKCESCKLIPQCSGCRAMAYAVTGDYLATDPQCWKQEEATG